MSVRPNLARATRSADHARQNRNGILQLTLDALNHATQAWVEMEYNRARHSEIGEVPAERYLRGPDARRPSPTAEELRLAFRIEDKRVQRRSDGTVTIAGVHRRPGRADEEGEGPHEQPICRVHFTC